MNQRFVSHRKGISIQLQFIVTTKYITCIFYFIIFLETGLMERREIEGGGKGEEGGVREEGVKGGAQIRRPDYTNKRLRRQTFVN